MNSGLKDVTRLLDPSPPTSVGKAGERSCACLEGECNPAQSRRSYEEADTSVIPGYSFLGMSSVHEELGLHTQKSENMMLTLSYQVRGP